MELDPECSLQDVVRCHLCEIPKPPLHCEICDKHLCKNCEEAHLSDKSKEHILVPFKLRGCITRCQKHSSKMCVRYCEQCKISACEKCVSRDHINHTFVNVVEKLESQKNLMQRDLEELEKWIYPKYQATAYTIPVQRTDLNKNSQKLTTAIIEHGDNLHRGIDNDIKKLKSDIEEMDSKHVAVLNKQEDKIKSSLSEITQRIKDLKNLLNSNNINTVSTYTSRNDEFKRSLSPKLTVTLPSFTPHEINIQFGSLSPLTTKTEKHGCAVDSISAEVSSSDRLLIDELRINSNKNTEYIGPNSASCLSDEQIWTFACCGVIDNMMIENLQTGRITYDSEVKSNEDREQAKQHSSDN